MKYRSLLAVLAVAVTVPAFAQTATPLFDQRQARQQERIEQGVSSGQLTEREAVRLDKGQDRLQRMEDKAKSDGVVTRQERNRLQHAEDVQSRHVYREKHDRQRDLDHDGRKDRQGRRK